MPTVHTTLSVGTRGRGTYEITDVVEQFIRDSSVEDGIVNVFCKHTSCSLVLMENADPSARRDLEHFFVRNVRDADPAYEHTLEGPDDMSAHIRMALTRSNETIPIVAGKLALGTWQGLFLYEHRTSAHRREVVLSVVQ